MTDERDPLDETAARLRRVGDLVEVPPVDPPASVKADIDARIAEDTGRSRRSGWLLAAAAALLLVVGGVAGALVAIGLDDGDEPLVAFTEIDVDGVVGEFRVVERPYGTEVELTLAGLAPGVYDVWLRDGEDTRDRIGGFGDASEGTLRFTSALSTEEVTDLWVTDSDMERVAWADLRP